MGIHLRTGPPTDEGIYVGSEAQIAEIRVGARHRRLPGPLGTGAWEMETIRRTNNSHRRLYFQEVSAPIIEDAVIRVHENIDIPCHRATQAQLQLLEATFLLVPPSHLQLVKERKPEGFLLSDTTGRGSSRSYMGGLNPGVNYPSTPNYDETRLIIITYGALWENRGLGICPTVLHEIGHVMTHRGKIHYRYFPEDRRTELEGTRVSRNPGRLEALCNAYMYMLCYGSTDPGVHNYGATPASNQKDPLTRRCLRRCPAFSNLPPAWKDRFNER